MGKGHGKMFTAKMIIVFLTTPYMRRFIMANQPNRPNQQQSPNQPNRDRSASPRRDEPSRTASPSQTRPQQGQPGKDRDR